MTVCFGFYCPVFIFCLKKFLLPRGILASTACHRPGTSGGMGEKGRQRKLGPPREGGSMWGTALILAGIATVNTIVGHKKLVVFGTFDAQT